MKKILSLLLTATLLVSLTACAEKEQPQPEATPEVVASNVIVSLAPSTTEILVGLGEAENIVAIDTWSFDVEGLNPEIAQFDMMSPDIEAIAALKPTVVFATGMSTTSGENPYAPLENLGVKVVMIPTSSSISAICDDIKNIAAEVGKDDAATTMVEELNSTIEKFKADGEKVTEKKSVYFEVSTPPYLTAIGNQTFINEMIEIIGATNIYNDQDGYVSANEEDLISKNPDVILTSVNYTEDPIGEIVARENWNNITAVKENAVYQINANASSRPSQNIVIALEEMAKVIYGTQE